MTIDEAVQAEKENECVCIKLLSSAGSGEDIPCKRCSHSKSNMEVSRKGGTTAS